MKFFRSFTWILFLIAQLVPPYGRAQSEVKLSSGYGFPGGGLTINEGIIKKHWFLYYPVPEAGSTATDTNVKDMHAAQIHCEAPSAQAMTSDQTGNLRCSVVYYLQGRNEARFDGKGYAFEVTASMNADITQSAKPFETSINASKVHSSKLIDPVLIRYKDYRFVIGRKSCAPDTISAIQGSTPDAAEKRKLLFCGVGLSMKKDHSTGALSDWIELDDPLLSKSDSDNIAPEVFWTIRNNHLILGGRQWHQVIEPKTSYEVSKATYMEKLNWVSEIDQAIKNDKEQPLDETDLSTLKNRITKAFSNFEIFPLTWAERINAPDHILGSGNYITLQPDILFPNDFPGHMLVHVRTRIEFPGEEAQKAAPIPFPEQNGMAYSVILKCHHHWGKMNCIPVSVFDNPWTKNTLQAFNDDFKPLYFIGHIAPSGSFKPGNRHQLYLYSTRLYQHFTADDFSSNTIDKNNKTLLLQVPPANSQFISDTTYPFFDPFTTSNPAYDCALFATTIRTKNQSGIAILCLDKSKLPPQKTHR
ncbi:hypothetical protein [Endozoicomonas montiporae]|nr:hypothetical protein [Endozoicomonas montiporae]AMO56793.1 hypothetical protein EZMO1_2741 [Endozoicomonas montiporae CL-33]